ncbi:MAG: cytochrome P450, partial [Mycobacterium sp.]
MAKPLENTDVGTLPLVPKNPLSYRQRLTALRVFHTGIETLRDAGGPVTRFSLGPRWLTPPVVVVTSPQGGRDILGRSDALLERNIVHTEVRRLLGNNLFDLTHEPWLSRRRALQPIFTKQHVRAFGGHLAHAAETLAGSWPDSKEVELDSACRRLTMRALGRSVFGLDLDDRADALAGPLRITQEYT